MRPVLAIDTSAGTSVALVNADDGAALALAHSPDARGHAERTAPLIAQVLAESGVAVTQLVGIAVGTGPAPFTGLRVGLVSADLLARSAGLSVWGVPSLDACAAAALRSDRSVIRVVTDARRREVYTAAYAAEPAEPGGLLRTSPFEVLRPADVPRDAPFVGAGTALYPEVLPGEPVGVDAVLLGALGVARADAAWDQGARPRYLRRPDVHGVPGAALTAGTGA